VARCCLPARPPACLQETKLLRQGQPDRVRALFERATTLTLPPKKMRFMFRR
jgi:hypothetical protein